EKARVREYIRRARPGAPGELRIDNPRDGSVFPPEFTPPTLVWRNEGKVARTWLIEFDVGDSVNVAVLRPSLGPPVPALDSTVLSSGGHPFAHPADMEAWAVPGPV